MIGDAYERLMCFNLSFSRLRILTFCANYPCERIRRKLIDLPLKSLLRSWILYVDARYDEHQDSDYESDPDSAGCEHDAFNDDIANVCDTERERENGTPGSLACKETHYEGSREAVRDIKGFDQESDDMSEDPWAPFTSAHGFTLASWFIQNKVSKTQIN